MPETVPETPPAVPGLHPITRDDIAAALREGLSDFRAAPAVGLTLAGILVAVGWALVLVGAGAVAWTVTAVFAFPLIAPFLAVGLYETSRRLHAGGRVAFGPVMRTVLAEKDRQIPWAGAMGVIVMFCWMAFAHMTYALFVGLAPFGTPTGWGMLWSGAGVGLALVELVAGGAVALLVFSMTALGLPMLVDREVDVISAIIASIGAVARTPGPWLTWAVVVAGLLLVGMIPGFLGLLMSGP